MDRPARPRLVSVVMPVLNEAATLPGQLEALARQDYEGEWEIVVADNGSTDATPDVVREWQSRLPNLRLEDASARKGINVARNAGAQAARGDFLVFCDADDLVTPGWLSAMARAAGASDLVGGYLDYGPLNDATTRSWRHPFPAERLPRALGWMPFAVGANFGIWKDVLDDLGGWNETYAGGGDEVELCWRAQLRSYSLSQARDAVIAYRFRGGLRALWKQLYRYGLAEPRLLVDFRTEGVPRKGVSGGFKAWLWILGHCHHLLLSPEKRGRWVSKTAFRWGRLRGSLKHRVLAL
ncbi:MAG: glycosyltransferase [Actinomycetota bacterium]|nr:glycosyltransferase [Actinomycetota bacterium]